MQQTRPLNPTKTAVLRVGSAVANDGVAIDQLHLYLRRLRDDGVQAHLGHGGDTVLGDLARATGAHSVVIREIPHVVDDDWACERLATELDADLLEYATDVPGVFTN